MNRYIGLVTFVILAVTLLVLSLSPSLEQFDTNHSSTELSQNNNVVEEKSDATASASPPSTKPTSFSLLGARLSQYAEVPSVAQAPKTLPDALESFNQWRKQKPANNNLDELNTWQANGVQLAQARQVEMQRLMRQHPEYAITQALSFPDYDALPDEVKAHVEQPFSATVNFDVLPQESKRAFHLANKSYIRVDDPSSSGSNTQQKQHWQTYRYGARETILSKRNIVVQGIRLGDEAVINEQALMPIAQSEVAYFKQSFPLVEKHQQAETLRDFYTDEAITGEPKFALAGGKLLAFSSEDNIQQLNKQLTALEQKNHPNYSSALVFEERSASLMSTISPSTNQAVDNNVPLAQQLTRLLALPSDWTTSVKKVLLIRVKPSDATDPAITQADLETALSNSSDLIVKLSQNKTVLDSTVSTQDFTLSQTAAYYAANDADVVLDEAKQLFSAANPNVDLTTYDIVGVHIGGGGIPVGWAGLASVGGGNYWLNNAKGLAVVTHEFGHIYGLGHSNFWETNNTSVVGNGSNDEYGDIYDIMGGGGAPEGYFHPQALEKIAWLTPTDWEDITTSGTYRVYRFDDENASGKRGLRISRNNTVDGYYWIGHRQNFDNNNTLENGAYLLWQRPSETKSWLVDTTPGSFADNDDDKQDAGIKLGQTYSDSAADIHITTLAKGGTAPNEWLDIQVNLGNVSNQAPTVSLTLPNTLTARTDLTFTATASDSDGDTLAYAWDFGDGVIHPSQASVTQSWVVGGTYTVNVTVSDMKGGTATAQQTITVTDPLTQWHNRTSPTNNHIVGIAANDTMAVAITDHAVLGSTDGETWTTLDEYRDGDTGFGHNTYLNDIVYDVSSQQWIAVGQDYNFDNSVDDWEGTVYTSPDGTNWTERYQAGSQLQAIASSGSVLVAVGSGGHAVRSSDGGATWSPVSTGISTALIDISYGNGQFIAVGNDYYIGDEEVVVTSSDGQSWSNQTTLSGSGANNGFRRIAYLNNQFIASGYNSRLSYLTNSAGINFVTTRANREPTDALMYGASIYFAAGINQDGSSKDIDLISLDGQTWTESPLSTDLDNRSAGVFFKNTFITVGKNGSIRQSDPITPVVAPVDTDNDTIPDTTDNCPNNANTDQADADNDGVGDVCDSTPNGADSDSDTIPDATDNCPNNANTDQADTDGDGVGDVCDDDRDGDGINNSGDAFPDDPTEQTDTDGDGVGNNADDDDDGDAIPDSWETANGLEPLDPSDAILDRDNNGINNLNEYFQSLNTIWRPTPNTTWQWQLKNTIDTSFDVDMYDIDLFDVPQVTIDQLKTEGRKVVCYFSAGSYEDWRSDAANFPTAVLGNDLSGWAGEKWLDIRALDQLAPIMTQRLDLAASKGCDGVEPDNIDAYQNNSGFPLTAADQLTYNQWLSVEAHKRGLSIGLKNDLGQVNELLQYFDWAINEECYQYDECDTLIPFINANKAVFGVEYQGTIAEFCPEANQAQFSWLYKNLDLDAQRFSCNDYTVPSNQQETSILLPLYKYPSHWDAAEYIWDEVAAAQSQVNITAIINPNNGSGGAAPNSDYQVGITALRDAGVTMLGYVGTCWANSEQNASCYNTRTLDSIKADIKTYADHFNIQGIFFDEAATNAAQANDYQELSNYARSLGLQLIVVNPGTTTDQSYVDQDIVANTAVTFESPYVEWQQTSPPTDWTQTLPARQSAALIYNVPESAMAAVVDEVLARNHGYLYITDDGEDGNPWDSLPSYWNDLLDYLADPNADSDSDTIPDATDNCPNNANTDQADLDNDNIGDVCDDDRDGDTVNNTVDNCPNDANTDQADADNDGVGDVCDTPATADAASYHNVIRQALSQQTTLNNLGANLDISYDFSQQTPPANALPDMVNDAALATSAAQYAQQCTFAHSTTSHGENIFAGAAANLGVENAVNAWASEVADYDYPTNSCAANSVCGHYTQVVNEASLNVGCAVQQCTSIVDGSGNPIFNGAAGTLVICQYSPAGNLQGQPPYTGGTLPDTDGDGVVDVNDNCSAIANPQQEDLDNDNIGDVCDDDRDGDTVDNTVDNCPNDANTDQADADNDGVGDACDTPSNGTDSDNDTIPDTTDNCPNNANTDQADADNDGVGDVCDSTPNGADSDSDTIPDTTDNCPNDANTDQADLDNDNIGDVCDSTPNGADSDSDTIPDATDNCPNDANTDQADLDNDNIGDVCDDDRDGDTVNNTVDNCPNYNNTNQKDTDNDGQGDVCDSTPNGDDTDDDTIPDVTDNCPNDANVYQADSDGDGQGDVCDTDRDGDTVNNDVDNCPDHSNLDQVDTDGDGQGDTCDPTPNGIDSDNDTIPDATDNCPLNPNPDQTDTDGDGQGDVCDIEDPGVGIGNLDALVDITDDWGTGFCANVNVHNTSTQLVDWSTQFDPQGQIYTIWGALASAPDASGLITAEGVRYNNTLEPNTSANFGYCAERTSDPNNTTELTVDVDYSNSWQTGYCATAWLQNDQDEVVDWTTTLTLPADKQGTVITMWGANYTENNGSLSIQGETWNNWLLPNQYTFFGFCVVLDSVSGSDTTPPAVTAPANLTGQAALKSKAFLTAFALSDLGVAHATDNVDGEVDTTLLSVNGDPVQIENNRILLRPGRNSVIWQAEDSAGNRGLAEQTVDVLPRANFVVNQSSSEGKTVTIEAWLNGDAPIYPVEIPFTLHASSTADSDDYLVSAHKIVIEQLQASDSQSNPSGAITVNLLNDGNDSEGTENLVFVMDKANLKNAVVGKKRRHKIKILEENAPPKVKLKITQGEKKGRFVVQGNGNVTVNAVAKDPNGDSLTYTWTANGLTDIPETPDDNPATFVFDPSAASTGRHKIRVAVSDGQASPVSKKKRIKIQAAEVKVANDADTDGDNILDKDELGDENGNGIPDYLEPPHDHHELPSDGGSMLSGEPGTNLGLGDIAFDSDGSSCSVSEQQITDYLASQGLPPYQPESQYNTEKIFDYTIAGLEEVGASSQIVLTLPTALTADSVIRKYNINTGQWSAFVEDANNQLETYISTDGNCTDDEDTVWQSGLVVGAICLRLTIEDGGANDADGEANGEIDDPVALASETTTTNTGGGSSGGDSGGSDDSGNTGGDSGSDDNTTVTTEPPTAKISIVEGDGANTINYFQLAINEPLSVDASVAYTTRSGTAKSGEDYIASTGTATIPAGETKALIAVEIIADNLVEGNETFSLVIVNPVGGVFPEGVSEVVATHTIIDDD
jgi:hypothetical protein